MCKKNLSLMMVASVVVYWISGCALTSKLAIGTIEPILDATVQSAYRAGDIETIRQGIPGNLLILRGLCESDPGNEQMRTSAVQLYFSYVQGFVEETDPARAARLYEEGMELGLEGLRRKGWFRRADSSMPLPEQAALGKMSRRDVPLVLWTMANWTGLIGLRQEDPRTIAQLPRVEAYLEHALKVMPDYFDGLGHVLLGTIWTFRPVMFGGDPVRGKRHFDNALEISDRRNLLYLVTYARYYCRQTLDEECFEQTLEEVLGAPEDLFPEYRLMNLLAKERAQILLDRREEFF